MPGWIWLTLLDTVQRTGKLDDYAVKQPSRALFSGWDSLRTIRESNTNTVVEISSNNAEPAAGHRSLQDGV